MKHEEAVCLICVYIQYVCFFFFFQAKSVMAVEVTAPAWLHRFIIGKKGQNIGRITQQLPRVRQEIHQNLKLLTFKVLTFYPMLQVHIEFTDGEERIVLEGPTEEVEQAQAQIQEIINDLVREFIISVVLSYHLFKVTFVCVIAIMGSVCSLVEDDMETSYMIKNDTL